MQINAGQKVFSLAIFLQRRLAEEIVCEIDSGAFILSDLFYVNFLAHLGSDIDLLYLSRMAHY